MKNLILILLLAPLLAFADSATRGPNDMWVPFARWPDLVTSDADELKSVIISCDAMTPTSALMPDGSSPAKFNVVSSAGVISFPPSLPPPALDDNNSLRLSPFRVANNAHYPGFNWIPDFPPDNASMPSPGCDDNCKRAMPAQYLKLNALKAPAAFNPQADQYAEYVATSAGLDFHPAGDASVKCRWLRRTKSDGASAPIVGLYCYGGSFVWNYSNYACAVGGDGHCGDRDDDNNGDFSGYKLMTFTGNVQKVHVYLPLFDTEVGPQGCQLNAAQVIANVDSTPTWIYNPFCETYRPAQVFQGFAGTPSQHRGSFSNSNCTVTWENN